jgi:hypothetical protein
LRVAKSVLIALENEIEVGPIAQPLLSLLGQPHAANTGVVVRTDDDQTTIDEGRDHDPTSLRRYADEVSQLKGSQPRPTILKGSHRTLLRSTETSAHAQV